MFYKQDSQALVEFALILPFFIFILFGIIYMGFILSDYLALNNMARSSAREASLTDSANYDHIRNTYYKQYAGNLNTNLLQLQSGDFTLSDDKQGNVVSHVHATMNIDDSNIGSAIYRIVTPDKVPEVNIYYRMYKE